MTARTIAKTVTFTRPFAFSGLERVQPAGTYTVETDEELIANLSFTAYRRTATWLRLPGRREGDEPPAGLTEVVAIDPVELDAALVRDAAHDATPSEPAAISGARVEEVRMELGSFRVVEQSRLEGAVVYVESDGRLFITRIDTAVFEEYFGRPRAGDDPSRRLTKRECNLLATANLKLIAPLIQAKVDAGEYGKVDTEPHPVIELTLADLRRSPTRLSDRILDVADRSGWTDA